VPEPTPKLAAKLSLRCLDADELGIVCDLEVLVLSVVSAAVRVNKASQIISPGRTARKAVGPLGLR